MLNNLEKKRITIIVNDMSQINIDSQLIIKRTEERMIELSNGCICCTLREDLLNQLIEIGRVKSCDYIVIESTGIAEPLHIAETFAYAEQTLLDPLDTNNKSTLSGLIKLDTMVTVVDLETFLYHYNSSEIPDASLCSTPATLSLDQSNTTLTPPPPNTTTTTDSSTSTTLPTTSTTSTSLNERTLSHLLIDQIQFANIIILNKSDLVSQQQCLDIQGIVTDLNPHAKIILSSYGRNIPIKKLINTNLFSYEDAEQHTEWFATEWGVSQPIPETIEYGITSITFQTHSKPFHPIKLYNFYHKYKLLFNSLIKQTSEDTSEDTNNKNNNSIQSQSQTQQFKLLRSKGFIWLPWNYQRYFLLHHTGGSLAIQEKDNWWIVKDEAKWPNNEEFNNEIGYLLRGEKAVKYGDRGNTLVLIGQHATTEKWNKITEELNNCLFSDEEMREMDGNEENKDWIEKWNNPFNIIPNMSDFAEPVEGQLKLESDNSEDDGDDNSDSEEEEEENEEDETNLEKKRLHSTIQQKKSTIEEKRNIKSKKE